MARIVVFDRDPDAPLVSILFGTYNRRALLERCVQACATAVGPLSYEIVVADGGSTDGSREWLVKQPNVVLVDGGLEGAVRAFNRAFDAAQGHVICTLNDDCVPRPQSIQFAVQTLLNQPGVGQVAMAFTRPGRPEPFLQPLSSQQPERWYANFGVLSRALAGVVAYIQGGLWWPGYYTYGGDCELSAWIHTLGWQVVPELRAIVDDLPAQDHLRVLNRAYSRARKDNWAYWNRWGRNLEGLQQGWPGMDEDCKTRFGQMALYTGSPHGPVRDVINRIPRHACL